MKIYKFGGASVRNASGVRNLQYIVSLALKEQSELVVVISAMGKTTNALERVVEATCQDDPYRANDEWRSVMDYHRELAQELGIASEAKCILSEADERCQHAIKTYRMADYDQLYDQVVSLGEWISTRLVSAYLQTVGQDNTWLEMADLLRTDDTFRDAQVDFATSRELIRKAVSGRGLCVAQGFIGGTEDGRRTTLGREGSDYTAALMGAMLDAESVTIWKDVPGILNADPRLVEGTVLIPELSYKDAVELAYSGAQIIHPKTIRPLHNQQIPLYVKPFSDPTAAGSVIHMNPSAPIGVPVYIWRKNQILITMRAKDFAFALEESLSHVFEIIHRHRLKVSLIQSSAVSISVCVDNTRYVEAALRELQDNYDVAYNTHLSLLTIRGVDEAILAHEREGRTILLSQTTRRMARLVVQDNL